MSEKGIIVTPEEVRLILSGKQTQKMLPMRPQPVRIGSRWDWDICSWTAERPYCPIGSLELAIDYAPYQIGDSLWLREPWRTTMFFDDIRPKLLPEEAACYYEAYKEIENIPNIGKLRPGMFLPKRFARPLRLPVTSVKIQRPQDLTLEEIVAEGLLPDDKPGALRRAWYAVWTTIYGAKSWELNPWSFVYSWEPVK